MIPRILLLFSLLLSTEISIYAQKVIDRSERLTPRWVKSTSELHRSNPSYEFWMIDNEDPSLINMKNGRLAYLGSFLKSVNNITGIIDQDTDLLNSEGNVSSQTRHRMSFQTNNKVYEFECVLIDDYWERLESPGGNRYYRYYTLYAVSDSETKADFDKFSATKFYGGHGLWRSLLVPGWGQMYKGDFLKGGLILGSCAALAAGIIFTECQRVDYMRKISMTHNVSHIQTYSMKADHFATARNICIGTAAALYLYNLIDAIVAPGAKRIIVHKCNGRKSEYAVVPALSSNGEAMLTASVRF